MKQILVTALAVIVWSSAFAQKSSSELYHNMADLDGVLAFTLNKETLGGIDTDFNLNGTSNYITGDFHKARVAISNSANRQMNAAEIVRKLEKLGFGEVELEHEADSKEITLLTNQKGRKLTEAHFIISSSDGTCVWLCIAGDMLINKNK